jgi:peptidoglycan/xylan/chitin deacetylase (PgdA/CDA1 family)
MAPPAPKGLPSLVSTGPTSRPRVALTFDADMTPAMLRRLQIGEVGSYYNAALIAELRRLQLPATLFLTGLWMQHYPDVTRELAADPLFELGTHTWQHGAFTADCYGLPVTPPSQMLEEVLRAQRLLDELAGDRSTRLFRFPGGCYDSAALRAIAPAGVTVVQFDVEGGDGFQHRPAAIVRAVVGGARNGSIVVLHMNGANTSPRTADAVGLIAEQLRRQGYVLTTVSGLFTPDPQPVTPPRRPSSKGPAASPPVFGAPAPASDKLDGRVLYPRSDERDSSCCGDRAGSRRTGTS